MLYATYGVYRETMICDAVCIWYIRELGEVCCMEVQPLRQPFHQVRALVSREGAG